jgi:hypothetical protein
MEATIPPAHLKDDLTTPRRATGYVRLLGLIGSALGQAARGADAAMMGCSFVPSPCPTIGHLNQHMLPKKTSESRISKQ